jgi:hypothetical protein
MRTVFNPLACHSLLSGGLKALLTGAGVKLHLYQNNIAPDPNNPSLAQFVEATYDGYAAAVPTWGVGPFTPPVGGSELQSVGFSIPMTGSTTPNVLYGWWIDDGTNWIMAGKFDASYPMNNASSNITLVPLVTVPSQPVAGDIEPIAN